MSVKILRTMTGLHICSGVKLAILLLNVQVQEIGRRVTDMCLPLESRSDMVKCNCELFRTGKPTIQNGKRVIHVAIVMTKLEGPSSIRYKVSATNVSMDVSSICGDELPNG